MTDTGLFLFDNNELPEKNNRPKTIQIKYVSARCGAGKTYSTCKYISQTRLSGNHLLVTPTDLLAQGTLKEFAGLDNPVTADLISAKTVSEGSVASAIVEHFKQIDYWGNVTLIHTTTFTDIPYFERRKDWNIYVDEVPQLDRFHEFDVHQHREVLLDHVTITNSQYDSIYVAEASNSRQLKEMLGETDDVTELFEDLFWDLVNPNKDVFVDATSWDRLVNGEVGKDKKSNRVYFLTLLNPLAFEGATMMAANFEDSMLYDWFQRHHNVDWVEHDEIRDMLRYTEHKPSIGERLQIAYILDDRPISKTFLESASTDGRTNQAVVDEEVLKYFGDETFLYAVNNDYEGVLDDTELTNAKKMPTISHGLNDYSSYTNIYFGAALNRKPKCLQMLEKLGFTRELIKNSTLHEAAYQALMRTALRDPNSTEIVNCLVSERETAKKLVDIFNGAVVRHIGEDKFTKMTPKTQAQKNRKCRFTKKHGYLFGLAKRPELRTKVQLDEDHPIGATFHIDQYAKHQYQYLQEAFSYQEIIQLMREASGVIINHKDDALMFNPAIFGNFDPDGHRRIANLIQSSFMVLDFDDGDLSVDDIYRIYGEKAGDNRRPFIICNTFSRNLKEQPNRFRVIFFYKQPARSIAQHQAVYDSIVETLEQHGFTEESAKLDRNCRTGNQSFRMPCTNQRHQDAAFFETSSTRTKAIEDYAFDPEEVEAEQTAKLPVKPQLMHNQSSGWKFNRSRQSVEEVLDEVASMPEGRRLPFLKAGRKLLQMGLSDAEVEAHLLGLEALIGKTSKRWAKYAMETLRKG